MIIMYFYNLSTILVLSWQEVGFTNQDNSDVLGLLGSFFLVFLLGSLSGASA